MTVHDPVNSGTSSRILAQGEDWRAVEVVCRSGPTDAPFEEQHEWVSVSAVMSGVFTYRSHRGRAVMPPGSWLLGNAGTCFECGHEHGVGDRCISFQCSPELVEETAGALKGLKRLTFDKIRIPPLEDLLPLLTDTQALARSPDRLRAEEMALRVLSRAFVLDRDAFDPAPGSKNEARVAQAVRIIDASYAEPLSIAQLARAVGMRRRALAAHFKHVVGVTPYNYILNRRLHAAAARLRDEHRTVLEIALDTGFGDLSEFTRRFKARFGMPPAAFRAFNRCWTHSL